MKLIVSTMKNEAPFLLEWLAYHQSIGFDAFLIYTNDCTDGTDFLLDRLQELGHVQHRRNDVLRRGPHKSALKYALQDPLLHEAEWVYVTDADEFLNIRTGDGKVDDLIGAYPGADVIPVTWRMFSSGGVVDFPFGMSLNTFTDAEPEGPDGPEKQRFVKSLFRPGPGIAKLGLHAPDYEGGDASATWGSPFLAANPGAEPRRPSDAFGYEVAQVNHYAVRSVDAYLLKRDRGRANHVGQTLDASYWLRWNRGGVEDNSIQRHLRATRRQMKALRADAEVAFLEEAGIALSEKRLATLLTDRDYARLRADLVGASAETGEVSPVQTANAKMKIKSPKRHQNRQSVLAKMPKGGRCAEIGVWQGGFTVEILSITEPEELILIDPWGLLAEREEDWVHSKNEDRDFMDQMYDSVVREFADAAPVKIRKGFSEEVLAEYPDDYFDWVYIDGNHLYDFVKSDVEICYRKVKPGGVIAGDDFLWKRQGRQHVKEAVHDAMGVLGLDPDTHLTVQGQQFMIQVDA